MRKHTRKVALAVVGASTTAAVFVFTNPTATLLATYRPRATR